MELEKAKSEKIMLTANQMFKLFIIALFAVIIATLVAKREQINTMTDFDVLLAVGSVIIMFAAIASVICWMDAKFLKIREEMEEVKKLLNPGEKGEEK
jgi:uncharacterized membrane protein